MPRLSLAMIVKDEQDTIGRVLDGAAAVCDEMIVVDTGSTDRTADLARAHGALVHPFPWVDDFAAARNASFGHCSGDWILWLDADDVLPEDSQKAIRALLHRLDESIDAVNAPYHYWFDDQDTCTFRFLRERLIRRAAELRWEGVVHEVVPVPDASRVLTAPDLIVEHRPIPERRGRNVDRNLRLLERAVQRGDRTARTLFYLASELADHQRWREAAEVFGEYLDLPGHWPPERYWAHLRLADCWTQLGRPDEARRVALNAAADDSSRAEAFVVLGRYHYDRAEWDRAATFFAAATVAARPQAGFVRDEDYGHRPWDYLSVCLANLGRFGEAIAAGKRALPGNPQAERVRANLAWCEERARGAGGVSRPSP